ncbi:MAG: hypothetical protein JW717_09620 [Marinilabiliaceae bacterium]|nr:hypothetical protein [Marinilabiliaceae bacterium]
MKRGLIFKMLVAALFVAVIKPSTASNKVVIDNYMNTDFAIISASLEPSIDYKISIKDEYNTVLYSNKLGKNTAAYQKLFDLSELSDGAYVVIFEGKNAKSQSKFIVSNNRLVSYIPSKEIEISTINTTKSYIRQSGDLIYVSQVNPDLMKTYVEIFNEKGDSVYSSVLPKQKTYAGLYKIKSLPKGQYTMQLTSGSTVHTYEFQK